MPSIVAITGKSVEDIETYYYGTQEYEAESAASGIIIAQNDDELLIATEQPCCGRYKRSKCLLQCRGG